MELQLAELAELCLVELYDRTRYSDNELTQYFPKVVEKFGETSFLGIREIAQRLQSKGYVSVITQSLGTPTQVKITPFGATTVESGGITGIMQKYRQNPSLFLESKFKRVPKIHITKIVKSFLS
jgi:hypothetical protein